MINTRPVTVGRRLALGFGVMAALVVMMVLLSLWGVSSSSSAMTEALRHQETYQAVSRVLIQANIVSGDAAHAAIAAVANASAETKADAAKDLTDQMQILEQTVVDLQDRDLEPREQAAMRRAETELAEFKAALNRILSLSQKNSPVDAREAAKLAVSNDLHLGPQGSALGDLMSTVGDGANEAVDEFNSVANRTRLLILGAGIVAVVVAVLLALLLTRSVTVPLRRTVERLSRSSERLASGSRQMSAAAEETASQAAAVAAAAEQVSHNVQGVASATEELGVAEEEIARTTTKAAHVASRALANSEDANSTVAKLGQSSAEIGDVVKVINSIAEQINLLALNATIEAARVGEAGKGFAIVASEVKDLARKTAKSSEEIGRKIVGMQANSEDAVGAIAAITDVIRQVNDMQTVVAASVEEQTAATNEISRSVSEASSGSAEIASNITGVATAAGDTTQGAIDMQGSADDLAHLARELTALVGRDRSDNGH